MGAKIAHFADALPITIFMLADRITNKIIKGIRPISNDISVSAPSHSEYHSQITPFKIGHKLCSKKYKNHIGTPKISCLLPYRSSHPRHFYRPL
jgi:hypothetical protein